MSQGRLWDNVSFKENFKVLQLICGLLDKEIQENVLAAGAALDEGSEIFLVDAVKLVEVAEMGKGISAQISKAGGTVFKLSDQRRSRDQGKLDKVRKNCHFCGRESHPREKCPARDRECRKCKQPGHFSAVAGQAKRVVKR